MQRVVTMKRGWYIVTESPHLCQISNFLPNFVYFFYINVLIAEIEIIDSLIIISLSPQFLVLGLKI